VIMTTLVGCHGHITDHAGGGSDEVSFRQHVRGHSGWARTCMSRTAHGRDEWWPQSVQNFAVSLQRITSLCHPATGRPETRLARKSLAAIQRLTTSTVGDVQQMSDSAFTAADVFT
jgi:hypothetical protein